ncbi:helix-turn-helix domain-containing protein [Streptococcus saliviloxodontae]|uniref:Transcriptional regulator with XRE-family HTH domain n=1 Tax=Streptococcus saliviloxodontae TaxID=1349416 RepID=A0ABS2PK78_9STRE|nr:helix-turn-helix transcriptional regulator [Streptococcus saliviloxodontae]MBM7635839.1 transcriptional regulator with XRE-family HTH domain [Streptococcus saliviloxodontae]
MLNYGYYFKTLRELKGFSLGRLAREAKLSKSTLSRFENGETQLALDKFMLGLQGLQISLSDFEFFLEHQQLPDQENKVSLIDDNLLDEEIPSAFTEAMTVVDDLVAKQDLAGLLTYQMSLPEELQLVKVICKKSLLDLGLDMLLPETDIEFICSYFDNHSLIDVVEAKAFLQFYDLLDPNQTPGIHCQLSDIQLKQLTSKVVIDLDQALKVNDIVKAKFLSGFLKQVTENSN